MHSLTKPDTLHPGDRVCLIAPARWLREDQVAEAIAVMESWGLEVVVPDGLFAQSHQFAGTDEHRAKLVQWALDHPDFKALWCIRGGYGTSRIVDGLRWNSFLKFPKWIIGYSDPSVLLFEAQRQEFCSIHATMPVNVPTITPEALSSLKSALMGPSTLHWKVPAHLSNQKGIATGQLVGGNLSILYSLLGSRTFPSLEGCILLLEDLDEYLYHVDRMVLALRRSGALKGLLGVVVGGLSDMHDNAVPFGEQAEEIIARQWGVLGIPIGFGFPFGHIDDNQAFINGCRAELRVSLEGSSLRYVDEFSS